MTPSIWIYQCHPRYIVEDSACLIFESTQRTFTPASSSKTASSSNTLVKLAKGTSSNNIKAISTSNCLGHIYKQQCRMPLQTPRMEHLMPIRFVKAMVSTMMIWIGSFFTIICHVEAPLIKSYRMVRPCFSISVKKEIGSL